MAVADVRFRVMASDSQVTLVDPDEGALEIAERRLRMIEQRWSRFLDSSDITRLNQNPADWLTVSSDTIRLIQTMQLAHRATDGDYDPTWLHQLLAAGYTSSIDDPARVTIAVESPCRDRTVHDVCIDEAASKVFVPAGLSLDPGGIGKGLAADIVVTELLRSSAAVGALVSVGGDIAAAGQAPTADGWIVHVEDPFDAAATIATLAVSDGGIATSSTRSRRWRHNNIDQHHVIDPLTGVVAETDLAAVTVIATAGWLAEAHATAAMFQGSVGVIDYLDSCGLVGLAVADDGTVSATRNLEPEHPMPGGVR